MTDGATATVRVVHDHAPTVGAHLCLRWVSHQLCCLWPGHDGTCLPLPKFPHEDVSDHNPRWRP